MAAMESDTCTVQLWSVPKLYSRYMIYERIVQTKVVEFEENLVHTKGFSFG